MTDYLEELWYKKTNQGHIHPVVAKLGENSDIKLEGVHGAVSYKLLASQFNLPKSYFAGLLAGTFAPTKHGFVPVKL
jgi:hypothetical protein